MFKAFFTVIILLVLTSPAVPAVADCYRISEPGGLGPKMKTILDEIMKQFPDCRDPDWTVDFEFSAKGKFKAEVAEVVSEDSSRSGSESFWSVGSYVLPMKEKELLFLVKKVVADIKAATKRKPDGHYDCCPSE